MPAHATEATQAPEETMKPTHRIHTVTGGTLTENRKRTDTYLNP